MCYEHCEEVVGRVLRSGLWDVVVGWGGVSCPSRRLLGLHPVRAIPCPFSSPLFILPLHHQRAPLSLCTMCFLYP